MHNFLRGLRKVIGKVNNPAQHAYVEGRQILDASLIVNELVDFCSKTKSDGRMCKLDMEKAFDNLNWEFLLKVMEKKGFKHKWLLWIRKCNASASFAVLVNGAASDFFIS
ncbi:uncharacterized protein LOC120009418 [Tripterygium wilfordii]|uniref:uncharacterized protein LOC120009418 n=1 Tax=Tripterygium wilfordii TaxID=458696 RepID=UPI0018F85DC8|nr:uncharacterized protein LOC120009418 [Tripterygium wilfordii]